MYRSRKDLAAYVKGITDKWYSEYERLTEKSVTEYIASLAPGSLMPEKRLYGESYQQQFRELTKTARQQIDTAIEEYRQQTEKKLSVPPTEDAMRLVQMFALRDPAKTSKEDYRTEVESLARTFGDNYQTFRALKDIAANGGVHLDDHPLVEDLKNLDYLAQSVASTFNASSAVYNGLDKLKILFFNMAVDDLFGE